MSIRSKPVAAFLVDLQLTKTHSRPHVPDNNPYSESQFKTLKYRPNFPERLGSIQDARAHCQQFLHWYNRMHRQSGIGLMPEAMHYGRAEALTQQRTSKLQAAFSPQPAAFQGDRTAAARCANSRVDQPTQGDRQHSDDTRLLVKLMNPGVSKSLTRSGRRQHRA